MLATADVFIENLRPGVLERMERDARRAGPAKFEADCALAADELARCVAAGIEDWRVISCRVRARCGLPPLAPVVAS